MASTGRIQPTRVIRVSGERRTAFERARERLFVLMLLFMALFAVVIGRLFMLTVVEANQSVSPISVLAQIKIPPRAEITDRNGIVLAKSMPSRSLYVRPYRVMDRDAAIEQVMEAIPGLSEPYLQERMAPGAPYRFIKRHLSRLEEETLRQVADPGLQFEDEYRRVYPSGTLAAHVLGFTNADGQGRMGVEASFNARLGERERLEQPVKLTIDARVQHAMEDVLARDIIRFRAEAGMGVLMHMQTGEVLALASLPTFDPNNVSAYPAGYQANRITGRTYELGSTFKAFTFAQGLELGLTAPHQICDASQPLELGRKLVHDRWALRRPITMTQALIRSSNTCTGRLGDAIGPDRQRAFLGSLGFLSPLRIELNETATYRMSSGWGRFATVTIAYGHGIAVTPLHLAQGAATVLNDGRPVEATLIPQNPVMKDGLLSGTQARVSESTSRTLRQLLRLAVIQGTGKAADVKGLRIGGKTGTAERARSDAAGYEKNRNTNIFLGAFPMDAPEYVLVMMLDAPQAETEGGLRGASANVAGSAGRFLRRAAPFLGVMPSYLSEEWLDDHFVVQAAYEPPDGWEAYR